MLRCTWNNCRKQEHGTKTLFKASENTSCDERLLLYSSRGILLTFHRLHTAEMQTFLNVDIGRIWKGRIAENF
jgi:hypothetical protein